GYTPDDEKFLNPCNPTPNRGNWDRQEGSEGKYGQAYDDERGWARGANHDDNAPILTNKMPYESVTRSLDHLVGLDDDATGMGSGNKLTGGGGPLTKGRNIGSDARPSVKTGPRTNARRS